jgi:ATP-dependent Zn protease
MNQSLPRSSRVRTTACTVLVLLVAGLLTAGSAAAAPPIRFQKESYAEFQKQLAAGQIHAVTSNKEAHTVHVTLNDRRHVLASYPSHDEPQIAALLRGKGISVKVKKAAKKASTTTHHKLRYIAGGILVVVILVVLVVLLIGRRRALVEESEGGAPAAATGGPAPEAG